jgi:hypothetical protein
MIVKKYVVYSLSNAVNGLSNNGLEYSEYSFILYLHNAFNNEEDAEKYIMKTMEDYKNRNVGQNTRFLITPTYVFNDDQIF